MRRRYFCKLAASAAFAGALNLSGSAEESTLASTQGNASADEKRDPKSRQTAPAQDLWSAFQSPPDSARPSALWMWMGSNISKEGISRDLEAMRESGIGSATIYSLADTLTPWACEILKSPTPDIIAFTEPWWEMILHAAQEAQRLGLELILHNCAGYESSGGTWIPPELSMQELVWSQTRVRGGTTFSGSLPHPVVDLHPTDPYPRVFIPSEGGIGIPEVEAKKTFLKEIAILAVPASGDVELQQIYDLTLLMEPSGTLHWEAPPGDWVIYRFGHTTTGAMVQPAQWGAMGLECDKMSAEAVTFHVEHVLAELKKHLGDLMGTTVTTLYFDSYEAGTPSWTPKMAQEFQRRRGYDPIPWLPVMAGRTIEGHGKTARFKADMTQTIHDLYRDVYWSTPGPLAHNAGLQFAAEPYSGPWEISEVVRSLDMPTVEFWTNSTPSSLEPVIKAAQAAGLPLVAAESFTSVPQYSRWDAHPAWLKPIGDAAFCAGVQRINLHNFVQQPWDDRYQPGNAMGQWGIHFGRNQTWWKPGKAWLRYLWRCQALLQRGEWIDDSGTDGVVIAGGSDEIKIRSLHRREGATDFFFVANVSEAAGTVSCAFPITGGKPELWDPVDGSRYALDNSRIEGAFTAVPIDFATAQSFFVVFGQSDRPSAPRRPDFRALKPLMEVKGPWTVAFDPRWGGPSTINFGRLQDWTRHSQEGIRYYSGTAVYRGKASLPRIRAGKRVYLDLGTVKHIAEVTVNSRNLGVVWTAPWLIDITQAVLADENVFELAITNVWANRLIGDEQQPSDLVWEEGDPQMKGGCYLKEFPDWFLENRPRPSRSRYTFTTWNYFTKDSPLVPSGLLGPVRVLTS